MAQRVKDFLRNYSLDFIPGLHQPIKLFLSKSMDDNMYLEFSSFQNIFLEFYRIFSSRFFEIHLTKNKHPTSDLIDWI